MEKSSKNLNSNIEWLKDKIEQNAIYDRMIKFTRHYIGKFGDLSIPTQDLIEKGLVNYMKSIGQRFSRVKKEADTVARKWQQQVDIWLEENNLTEKPYSEQFLTDKKKLIDEKPIEPLSPQLNGTWEANQRNSNSDYRQNYHSSSSQEVESPDSQIHIERNSTFNSRSNNFHSFHRKSSSPLQLENRGSRNLISAEFNANLSIDPREITPVNKTQSTVKPFDRFCIVMEESMFKVVKLKKPLLRKNMNLLEFACDIVGLQEASYPSYLTDYLESQKSLNQTLKENSDSINHSKSVNGQTDKKIDSHHLPSTTQQGSTPSSRSCPESTHDRKRKEKESTQPVFKVKELRLEQQPSFPGKLKHREPTLPVVKVKEEHHAEDSKLKRMARAQPVVVRGKELKAELHSTQGRMLKYKETTQSVAKAKELKVEQQPIQDGRLNLDIKRVCAMAPEARNCDKNNIKRRESPDQSAMIAITSSKKERTSVYHGGRKCELPKLKDLCISLLLRALKKVSDPTKYINKNASFEVLEPILVQLSPDKLHKLEEEKKYLLANTDLVWKLNCDRRFKSHVHLRRKNEPWRVFFARCCVESDEKLKNLTASITASASKVKPDRQIKFTTVDGPPTKRQKMPDYATAAKCNGNNSIVKPLPNSTHPSNSRSVVPVPPKVTANHIKPAHRTIKKDAPLMHKAKKTLGQLNRIHRN